jgi:hypothetical protein
MLSNDGCLIVSLVIVTTLAFVLFLIGSVKYGYFQ